MLSVRQALDQIVSAVSALGAERVGLFEAVGRVLAEDVHSQRDVPGYANSAMDGYAVRHADVARTPARLRVTGLSAAGNRSLPTVGPGEAARIMTGAPVPPGGPSPAGDRKSTRLNSSHEWRSYAVVCLQKKQSGA